MPGTIARGHATAALILGIVEVVCGLLIIILSVVMMGKADLGAKLAPYWAGIVFAIPGVLGIVVGVTKNHCCMIAFMVLNIIAFIIEGVAAILLVIVIAVWAAIIGDNKCIRSNVFTKSCTCYYDGGRFNVSGVDDCGTLSTIAGLMIGVLVFMVIAAIVSLASSILGCAAVCCSNNSGSPGAVVLQQTKY